MEEALYLTNHATKVTVIHRRDAFRGEKILQERIEKNEKIAVVWDSVVEDINGDEKTQSLRHWCYRAQREDR